MIVITSLAVLLLLAAACLPQLQAQPAPVGPPAKADPIARGAALFAENCSGCHGQEAQGGLGPAPALDGSAHAWHHPDQQLYDFICRGKPGIGGQDMPASGEGLSPEEIRAIVAYFQSLWSEEQRRQQREVTGRVRGQFPPCP